ncbi:MAG: hypothetical protein LBN39_09785, partial [Planctomycetaceae bacterium]|nr:hypothetical protein [Planctomycetaceae bacterium]
GILSRPYIEKGVEFIDRKSSTARKAIAEIAERFGSDGTTNSSDRSAENTYIGKQGNQTSEQQDGKIKEKGKETGQNVDEIV